MKVLTFGVFDCFHIGHLRLLEKCSKLGDFLIVAVQKDEEIKKTKPTARIVFNLEERMEIINSIKYVNLTIPYSQIDTDISSIDFDILVTGPDQNHDGFKRAIEWCRQNGKKVLIIERTEGVSSTMLRGIKF